MIINHLPRWRELNSNVRVVLAFSFLWMLCRALWENTQMAAYIFVLTNKNNTDVGIAQSIEGVSQLMTAIPAGIAADKYRRDSVLRVATLIGILSISMTCIAVAYGQYKLICAALGLWGAAYALNDSPMEALFADSTTMGQRAQVFSLSFSLRMVGRACGGFITACVFAYVGNQWTIPDLKIVIIVGLLCTAVPILMQASLKDDRSLKLESQALVIIDEGLTFSRESTTTSQYLLCNDNENDNDDYRQNEHRHHRLMKLVPILLATTDLLTAVGAGATVKFFGLFFIDHFALTPFQLYILLSVTPFVTGISTILAEHCARRCGRVTTIMAYHLIGTALLLAFALAQSVALALPLFVSRTAIMNSFKPLKRSLLMDVVPKHKRGRWNSLESLTRFSWSGSAALGGFIVDRWGYRVCFVSTAVLYTISVTPIVILWLYRTDEVIKRSSTLQPK